MLIGIIVIACMWYRKSQRLRPTPNEQGDRIEMDPMDEAMASGRLQRQAVAIPISLGQRDNQPVGTARDEATASGTLQHQSITIPASLGQRDTQFVGRIDRPRFPARRPVSRGR